MTKFTIKAYSAIIHSDWYDNGCSVLIGVVPDDLPVQAWDTEWWADDRIYFYLSQSQFDAVKAGDVLNDGEDFTVTEIDKTDPQLFETEYEEEAL